VIPRAYLFNVPKQILTMRSDRMHVVVFKVLYIGDYLYELGDLLAFAFFLGVCDSEGINYEAIVCNFTPLPETSELEEHGLFCVILPRTD
jgi:hypothetical protein